MAEAHQAVAFSFLITHEGWDINYDREVLDLVWDSGVRSWRKRLARFYRGLRNGAYPAHLHSLWIITALLAALHLSGKSRFDSVNFVLLLLPGQSILWELFACFLTGLMVWLFICFLMRNTLKLLLMYKGWMYESRAKGSKISMYTKIWATVTKLFIAWNTPGLYSFQVSLPILPLPSIHDTLKRYLDSVHPLLDDDNYKRMQGLAHDFETTIAPKLQKYLTLKSWWSSNYVSDWWEEYVYLRGRSSLMVNSNFYGLDAIFVKTTDKQAARAAMIIHLLLYFRRLVERQELQPVTVHGLVPLCSSQYERIFNTARIPGIETDKIVHYMDSNWIVVLHKGRYYKVIIYYKGRLLKPYEIQIQIEDILASNDSTTQNEDLLASLTAWNRTKWAQIRNSMFNKGINRINLQAIESSAFVVSLDDEAYDTDYQNGADLSIFGKAMLHGNGHNRWFDKSFTVCIGSNGRFGFNAEHSWGDATILSHLWEFVVMEEITRNGYDENGNCIGPAEFTPPPPKRMAWDLKHPDIATAIKEADSDAQTLLNDLHLHIFTHDDFGKGLIKKCRLSPDAFLQMALQLAYYRDAGRFSLTYEATITRLFRDGRTETVRPVTDESATWVKSMLDPNSTAEKRIELLRIACARHQRAYQDAMCGKGIDRHLFCLYVVSKYLELDSPFLNEVLSEPWRLSTSQTPHGQTPKMDLSKYPNCISAGGGFGPVADDGYGVSYIIAGENIIFFHISSKRSSPLTDSDKFAKEIHRALQDIRLLFEDSTK